MSLLEIKNLHARVAAPGGNGVVKGVGLTVDAGQVHAIVGPNDRGTIMGGRALSTPLDAGAAEGVG